LRAARVRLKLLVEDNHVPISKSEIGIYPLTGGNGRRAHNTLRYKLIQVKRNDMKRIFVPTEGPGDWQRLLAKPQLHWKKGASAMTAAAAWEETPGNLPEEIETILSGSADPRLVHLTLLAAIPEWETALEGGERNSHTDVLALTRNDVGLCVIAVEAKVNEDFGPLVSDKRKGASEGQDRRIKFLEGLLRIEPLGISSCIGQLLRCFRLAPFTRRPRSCSFRVLDIVRAYDSNSISFATLSGQRRFALGSLQQVNLRNRPSFSL
jgi:uncharacterized protein DUF6946